MSLRDMFIDVAFNVRSGELKEVNSSLNKFKGGLRGAEASTSKLEHATSKAGSTLDRLKSRFAGTDTSANKLKGSTAAANRELEHTQSSASKAEGGLSSLTKKLAGAAAGYLGLQKATGLFKTGMNEAAGLEGYRNTLNAVMHDTKKAGDTMVWAVDFANKTPFETNEVVDATVKLQSYGMNARDVMNDIGDMAGVMNKSLDQAVEAIADAQTGELERLKEFGITKQMIVDQGNKIMRGKEIVNNKGQITDQKAFNQALFSLMQERFKGGMDLQANSFKGIMSTVTGVAKGALAQFMGISKTGEIVAGGMFDRVKNKAKQLGDTLQKWQDNGTIDRLSQKFISGLQKVDNGLKFLKNNSSWIVPMVSGIGAVMGTLKVGSLFKQFEVVSKVGSSIGTVTKAAGNLRFAFLAVRGGAATFGEALTFLMGPLGIAALIIGGVVVAGVLLYKNWDTIKAKAHELGTKISETWNGIKTATANAWNGMIEHVKSFGTKIYSSATGTVNKVKEGFSSGWNATVNGVKNFGTSLHSSFDNTMSKLKTNMTTAWNGIKAVTMTILTPFINGVTNIFNHMRTGITNILNGFKNVFIGIWNATLRPIGGLVAAFLYLITGHFGQAKEMLLKSMKSVQTGLLQIWTGIKQIFIGYAQAAVGFVIGYFQNAKSTILTIWNFVKTSITNIWNGIKQGVSTAAQATANFAINAFNNAKASIINTWNNVKASLAATWQSIYSTCINTWNNILNFFATLPGRMATYASNMMTSLRNGISNGMSAVSEALHSGIENAVSFVKNLPSKFAEWGKDMIHGLASGIRNTIGEVTDAVTGVADKIKSFLHFSRPDVGPLREYEEWMPDMMQGLRQGITNNTNLVIEPIRHLSIGMAEPLNKAAMTGSKATESISNKVSDNNKVVNNKKSNPQIIYAPKFEVTGSNLNDILQQIKDISRETFEQIIKENFYAIEN